MSNAVDIVTALQHVAWPVIVGALVWRLLPSVKRVIDNRGFTIKAGQFEFTAQEWSEGVLRSTAEAQASIGAVQNELACLKAAIEGAEQGREGASQGVGSFRQILWVDDFPAANRYEAAQLELLGARVVQARSTQEALERISHEAIDLLITNAARNEAGGYDTDAGRKLVAAVRKSGFAGPIMVYSPSGVGDGLGLLQAGATEIAKSPSELYTVIGKYGEISRTRVANREEA